MTSLIKSLSLKNFKGFSDEVRIELRPITLLFGANSVGKSSVLQAMQYVREILERNNANADRTLQGGDAVDLGGFLNLVHDRDAQNLIEIEIAMSLGEESIPDLVPEAFEDWQTYDNEVWHFYETLQGIRKKVEEVSVRLSIGWNDLRKEAVVVAYEISTNAQWCVKFESSPDGRDVTLRINRDNPIFLVERPDYSQLLAETKDLEAMAGLEDWVNPADLAAERGPSEVSETSDVEEYSEENIPTAMMSVWPELLYAVREAGMERPGDGLRAWLTGGFQGALPRLDQMLSIPVPGAKGAEGVYTAREFTAFLSWITIGPAVLLRNQLQKMRYVGPLRRVPPRNFEAGLTKNDAAWSDGMAAWESLSKAPQSLVDRCSDWMANPKKLGTGYAIDRLQVQEFDMSQPVPKPLDRVRTRLALLDADRRPHQPQDVGVGISQVLPVVVAAQDGSASLVCIEQPELHIHPSIQVGLGDLFIDGALNQGLSFLIETHSEHLVMRLQRRVREQVLGELPSDVPALDIQDVSFIYLGRGQDGNVTTTTIGLSPDGKFDAPWPNGFFSERASEVLSSANRAKLNAARHKVQE